LLAAATADDMTDERASPATFFGLFFSGLAGFASGRGLKG